jgi:hypothetical protein
MAAYVAESPKKLNEIVWYDITLQSNIGFWTCNEMLKQN